VSITCGNMVLLFSFLTNGTIILFSDETRVGPSPSETDDKHMTAGKDAENVTGADLKLPALLVVARPSLTRLGVSEVDRLAGEQV